MPNEGRPDVQQIRAVAQWQARALQPPLRPRVPLACEVLGVIGSVESALLAALRLDCLRPGLADGRVGWTVTGSPTDSLALLALALREAGYVRAWRDEPLAVRDATGRVVGQVERGVTRLLGIATEAVHLLGLSPDGHHWIQQRAWNKPDDPGLWDTLVGGMVPAGESVDTALARECDEEAGLALSQLVDLRPGGWLTVQRPTPGTPEGYTVERIAWFRAQVPADVVPVNRDGEVAQFKLMTVDEVCSQFAEVGFTLEAALMLQAEGVPVPAPQADGGA
jgi:ADP-ribose pyrophosphatase YjhB (NUDIX family)